MARPQKQNLDYFPLDTIVDDNVEIIQAEHGMAGYGILISLWQKIYQNCYFIIWDRKTQILFSKRINTPTGQIQEVIDSCISWGIFNKKLYEEYNILTSRGIQKRYITAMTQCKRKNIEMIREFLLVKGDISRNITTVNIVNSEFTNVSSGRIPEELPKKCNKEKKRKEKERKEDYQQVEDIDSYSDESDKRDDNFQESKIQVIDPIAEDLVRKIQCIFIVQNQDMLLKIRNFANGFVNSDRYDPEVVIDSLNACKTQVSMGNKKNPWEYFRQVYTDKLSKKERYSKYKMQNDASENAEIDRAIEEALNG